jgi:hypothetical protein
VLAVVVAAHSTQRALVVPVVALTVEQTQHRQLEPQTLVVVAVVLELWAMGQTAVQVS